jgi:hypothetical protein
MMIIMGTELENIGQISTFRSISIRLFGYPTQKPLGLLERSSGFRNRAMWSGSPFGAARGGRGRKARGHGYLL